ncbi:hypothetical protein VNI00_003527 [Paramarasmius palmivorus]|uniref:Glycosyltransferase family 8 protein n=1 Tax=Paramarasmius palmivorus TaxID=297713 RepID=A0AAW0DS13_9AGAR
MTNTSTETQRTTVYRFTPTQDWFSHNIAEWTRLLPLVKRENPRVLEIGSWEGRSAVFLLENLCKDGGDIVCIDHFDLFSTEAGRERYDRIQHNLNLTGKSFRIISEFSVTALLTLLSEATSSNDPGFDWIYVDGSHEADDTLLDGELAWRLARKDAVVIFDDYHWNKEPEDSIHHPKRGIDAFLELHQGEYERLTDPSCYQVALRKLSEMRIGFLVKGVEEQRGPRLEEALGYGINVALTVDSAYAVGAAVTMRSIVETTPGRITFYVVDCGLSPDDKERLCESIPVRDDVTTVFIPIPQNGLSRELGTASWAKLDLCDVLPVERALYLDADLLVRSSLQPLWSTDMEGKPIAAVLDVGYPLGHGQIHGKAYFNAGVLLLDLAKIRLDVASLADVARAMKDSLFKDQDALNAHFREWTKVSLEWNAQGLGTYAKYPSDDRRVLDLNEMEQPKIVHFTGSCYPPLPEVLNPYVQPPPSKPWGYLEAFGHPFRHEWWQVVERTKWAGIRDSESWKMQRSEAIERSIEEAVRDLHSRLEKVRDV